MKTPKGSIAVIFVAQRTEADPDGYASAAAEMEAEAETMPGYLGLDSARGNDGLGVTISYWRDETSAAAWREHARHREVQQNGRASWYQWYRVALARIERSHQWPK